MNRLRNAYSGTHSNSCRRRPYPIRRFTFVLNSFEDRVDFGIDVLEQRFPDHTSVGDKFVTTYGLTWKQVIEKDVTPNGLTWQQVIEKDLGLTTEEFSRLWGYYEPTSVQRIQR